jgi:gamma-glutamylcyclotransferase (GGCT)/AIG2-like uncharacterized protein YtfP
MNEYFLVYGTLRRGHGNNRLLATSEYICDYVTEPKYTMISKGGFPAVKEGGNTAIVCELYKVTDKEVYRSVMSLEGCTGEKGHPNNWYDFVDIEVDGKIAHMFIMNNAIGPEVTSGDWKNREISSR